MLPNPDTDELIIPEGFFDETKLPEVIPPQYQPTRVTQTTQTHPQENNASVDVQRIHASLNNLAAQERAPDFWDALVMMREVFSNNLVKDGLIFTTLVLTIKAMETHPAATTAVSVVAGAAYLGYQYVPGVRDTVNNTIARFATPAPDQPVVGRDRSPTMR